MDHDPSHSGSCPPTSSTAIENICNVHMESEKVVAPPPTVWFPGGVIFTQTFTFIKKKKAQPGLQLGQQNQGTCRQMAQRGA